ncbi:transcriptional regulator [Rhodococcus sp. PAMC28707]|nr:transcriptional regulator [Rhodococcus sp. PAMC28705]QCB60082.1 transcriptional regulator [Rhodococcus sp. PAMC28707]
MTHPSSNLNDIVHQRNRLGILAVLVEADEVEFVFVKDVLALTAGNLSRHLSVLAGAELVHIRKEAGEKKTWVSVTKAGRRAFRAEIDALRKIVEANPVEKTPPPPGGRS